MEKHFYCLDSVRVLATLLGIVLHASLAFTTPAVCDWPIKDAALLSQFDMVFGLIHLFRLPLFFLLSGLLTALLIQRLSARAFIRNRLLRIGVPFASGMLLLTTIRLGVWHLQLHYFKSQKEAANTLWCYINDTGYLWFLYYLLSYYALILMGHYGSKYASKQLLAWVQSIVKFTSRPLGQGLLLPAVTTGALYFNPPLYPETPMHLQPEPALFGFYLLFFLIGYGWMQQQCWRPALAQTAGIFLLLGLIALFPLCFWGYIFFQHGAALAPGGLRVLITWLYSMAAWSLVIGVGGLCVRWADRPWRWMRYLADASYWLYLLQVPTILIVQSAIVFIVIPPVWKFILIVLISSSLMLVSYHYGVRYRWIGYVLHGRREKALIATQT